MSAMNKSVFSSVVSVALFFREEAGVVGRPVADDDDDDDEDKRRLRGARRAEKASSRQTVVSQTESF